jgi:hypothetical protein
MCAADPQSAPFMRAASREACRAQPGLVVPDPRGACHFAGRLFLYVFCYSCIVYFTGRFSGGGPVESPSRTLRRGWGEGTRHSGVREVSARRPPPSRARPSLCPLGRRFFCCFCERHSTCNHDHTDHLPLHLELMRNIPIIYLWYPISVTLGVAGLWTQRLGAADWPSGCKSERRMQRRAALSPRKCHRGRRRWAKQDAKNGLRSTGVTDTDGFLNPHPLGMLFDRVRDGMQTRLRELQDEESRRLLGGGLRVLSTSGRLSDAKPRRAAPPRTMRQKNLPYNSQSVALPVFEIPLIYGTWLCS